MKVRRSHLGNIAAAFVIATASILKSDNEGFGTVSDNAAFVKAGVPAADNASAGRMQHIMAHLFKSKPDGGFGAEIVILGDEHHGYTTNELLSAAALGSAKEGAGPRHVCIEFYPPHFEVLFEAHRRRAISKGPSNLKEKDSGAVGAPAHATEKRHGFLAGCTKFGLFFGRQGRLRQDHRRLGWGACSALDQERRALLLQCRLNLRHERHFGARVREEG